MQRGCILEPPPDRGCVRRTSRSKCGCPKSPNDPKPRGLAMPLRLVLRTQPRSVSARFWWWFQDEPNHGLSLEILSDFQRPRRYACDDDNERHGFIEGIRGPELRRGFCHTGQAAPEPCLFGGVAAGPVAAIGRRDIAIRFQRPGAKRAQAEIGHNFDGMALSGYSPHRD